MSAEINLRDVPAAVRKQLGLKRRPQRSMTMHEVRSYSLRVMAVMADLTQRERARVLRQALKVNDV